MSCRCSSTRLNPGCCARTDPLVQAATSTAAPPANAIVIVRRFMIVPQCTEVERGGCYTLWASSANGGGCALLSSGGHSPLDEQAVASGRTDMSAIPALCLLAAPMSVSVRGRVAGPGGEKDRNREAAR